MPPRESRPPQLELVLARRHSDDAEPAIGLETAQRDHTEVCAVVRDNPDRGLLERLGGRASRGAVEYQPAVQPGASIEAQWHVQVVRPDDHHLLDPVGVSRRGRPQRAASSTAHRASHAQQGCRAHVTDGGGRAVLMERKGDCPERIGAGGDVRERELSIWPDAQRSDRQVPDRLAIVHLQ